MSGSNLRAVVSVVVPTYRRHDLLVRCIEALVRQDFAASEWEILVADDANSPATRKLVEQLAARSPIRIRYLPVAGGHGPAAARNVGWRAAAGEYIAFTDDDCVPAPGWLWSGVATLESGVDAAWGTIQMPLPDKPTDYERDAAGLASAGFVTANCFCRREALEQVGGFDEQFTAAWREDSDLYFSLCESDCVVVHEPSAVVVHPIRPARWGVSLRQQRKTMFDALLYKKHRSMYRQHVPPVPWQYYATVASALAAAAALGLAHPQLAWPGLAVWAALTLEFCLRRLRRTTWRPPHVAEMLVTSVLIPPLSLFWHLRGAVRFHVLFR